MYDDYGDLLSPKNKKAIKENKKIIGICPICNRNMIEGKSIDQHHFVPKSKKGKDKEYLHLICHRKLHSVFTEKEMKDYYNTPKKCLENEEIRKFVKWVSKKEDDFVSSNKETKRIKGKRRK